MTKEKKIIIVITSILTLIIVILTYFLINKNAMIKKQAEKIELQTMETKESNSYVTTQDHLKEISQSAAKSIPTISRWHNTRGGTEPYDNHYEYYLFENIKGYTSVSFKLFTVINYSQYSAYINNSITSTATTPSVTLGDCIANNVYPITPWQTTSVDVKLDITGAENLYLVVYTGTTSKGQYGGVTNLQFS